MDEEGRPRRGEPRKPDSLPEGGLSRQTPRLADVLLISDKRWIADDSVESGIS